MEARAETYIETDCSGAGELLRQSKRDKKKKAAAKNTVYYTVLTLMAVFLLFPFLVMLFKSFMTPEEVLERPVRFFPSGIRFEAYLQIFNSEYILYTFNTLKIVAFNVIAVPVSCSLSAFAFSKLKWAGREVVFACVLATIMIPTFVVQVPQYVMFSNLGMTGTAWPLMLPQLFGGGAINIFLMRQFMRGIPNTIDEAARIDGASAMRRFAMITIPLCLPILIFIMVGVFTASWSDFFGPLVYLNSSESKYTLAIGIYKKLIVAGSGNDNAELRCAVGVFMSLFPAILFFIFQKQLIEGVTVGAVKG